MIRSRARFYLTILAAVVFVACFSAVIIHRIPPLDCAEARRQQFLLGFGNHAISPLLRQRIELDVRRCNSGEGK